MPVLKILKKSFTYRKEELSVQLRRFIGKGDFCNFISIEKDPFFHLRNMDGVNERSNGVIVMVNEGSSACSVTQS